MQEIVFSCKTHKISHPKVNLNDSPVVQTTYQKHLGLYLDEKLNFSHNIKEKISKAYRGIGVVKKLQNDFPRQSLLTIYKSFIRPHLDYGDESMTNHTMRLPVASLKVLSIMQF